MRLLLALTSVLLIAGCGDDAPTDADARIAEANARAAEAEARAAEATAAAAAASSDAPEPAPADPPPATTATGGTASSNSGSNSASRSTSTRPGLTGLPPATNSPDLLNGTQPFRFCETYTQTAVSRYQGMELCYAGTLRQDGGAFVGSSEKDSENGRTLRGAARTDFRIEGRLYDDYTFRFNFTDKGARRVARGSASFPGDAMNGSGEGYGWPTGTFQTDAANSSGTATFFISQDAGV